MVNFGETKAVHQESMETRETILGGDTVNQLYEYKNIGVLKNHIFFLSSDVDGNIEKTHNKAEMIYIYVKGAGMFAVLFIGAELLHAHFRTITET